MALYYFFLHTTSDMLLHIPQLLNAEEILQARAHLQDAPWIGGKSTAGMQAVVAKNNEQLPESSEQAVALRQIILRGLERSPLFFSAALPRQVSPPLMNRYGVQGMVRASFAAYNTLDEVHRFVEAVRRVSTMF